jgi:hypothetical protein
VLKILRFDDELGPRWAGEIMAEGFQAHDVRSEGHSVRRCR